jgi:hypothetical protein
VGAGVGDDVGRGEGGGVGGAGEGGGVGASVSPRGSRALPNSFSRCGVILRLRSGGAGVGGAGVGEKVNTSAGVGGSGLNVARQPSLPCCLYFTGM